MQNKAGVTLHPAANDTGNGERNKNLHWAVYHHGHAIAASQKRLLAAEKVAFSDMCTQSHVKGQICNDLEVRIMMVIND